MLRGGGKIKISKKFSKFLHVAEMNSGLTCPCIANIQLGAQQLCPSLKSFCHNEQEYMVDAWSFILEYAQKKRQVKQLWYSRVGFLSMNNDLRYHIALNLKHGCNSNFQLMSSAIL